LNDLTNPGKKLVLLGVTAVAVLLLTTAKPQIEAADGSPIQAGEKLSYRISWSNVLEAGIAELSVTPSSKVPHALKFELKASTSAALAPTYPFTDEFVSHFDTVLSAPALYEKSFTEKKRVVREQVNFNQLLRLATFTNSKNQSKRVPIEVGTQDPVSALYVLRSLGLTPGVQLAFPVLDGGTLYFLDASVAGTELMTTKLGSFKSSRVEVSIRRDGRVLEDKKITVWLTTDSRRLPVLASVALPVGAAVIELISQTP
jgi:hypothetical protein